MVDFTTPEVWQNEKERFEREFELLKRYGEYEEDVMAFFPEYRAHGGYGTMCFDHPALWPHKVRPPRHREVPSTYTVKNEALSPQTVSGAATPAQGVDAESTGDRKEERRLRFNRIVEEFGERMGCANELTDWKVFNDVIADQEVIQEIFVEARESRPLVNRDGPRQRYQRFREKAFICDICEHWFTLKQNVQMHIFNYHMGPNQIKPKRGKRYKCTKCDQMFKSMQQALKHEKRQHHERVKQMFFRCEQCPKIYQTASQLREHISIMHLHERPFKCEQCDASFGRRGGLRRHVIMVHTDHMYKCPIEGCEHPGYKCSKALAAHIRSVHTKDRPFVCLMCEKSFVRKNDLKMHEFTHGTGTSFPCEHCGQSFKRSVYLRKHQEKQRKGKTRVQRIKEEIARQQSHKQAYSYYSSNDLDDTEQFVLNGEMPALPQDGTTSETKEFNKSSDNDRGTPKKEPVRRKRKKCDENELPSNKKLNSSESNPATKMKKPCKDTDNIGAAKQPQMVEKSKHLEMAVMKLKEKVKNTARTDGSE